MNKKEPQIGIIDYGVGNIFNIEKACRLYSSNVVVINSPDEIKKADAIILPGVGAFAYGMEGLKKRNLAQPIKDFSLTGKPILGICLGAQLLMSKGYEMGEYDGLGLISGKVVLFHGLLPETKIPNIGWLEVGSHSMYFVHSYIIEPDDSKNIEKTANYGGRDFCAIVHLGNIYGTQFHPEKSGKWGLKFIEDFIKKVKKHE